MPGASEVRGEIDLELGGSKFVLRPSRDAIRAFEKTTKRALIQLAGDADDNALTIDAAAEIITECVKAWGKANNDELALGVNPKKIGDLVMENGLLQTNKVLALLLFLAATGGYTPSGEVRPLGSPTA
jgi:hypothetical protein